MANRAFADIARRAIRNLSAPQVPERTIGLGLCLLAALGSHVADPPGDKHSSYKRHQSSPRLESRRQRRSYG